MNIKSLLLGSAAAFVAVSGARAADAVVIAEPEPMEYVRICDTYGAGFYYIPGTETCLKVSGYMRYEIGVGEWGHQDVIDKEDYLDEVYDTNDTYSKNARFQLRVDARNETELGTLRAYAAINFNYTTSDSYFDFDDGYYPGITTTGDSVGIDHAYIELGGFRIGKTDSLFETFTGSAGNVIQDSIVGYTPGKTHQIAYTFTGGNGFVAAVALEEGSGPVYTLDSYAPHVVGGLGYVGAWGGVTGVVGYDAVYGEWAAKARVDFNVNDAFSVFVMGGISDTDEIAPGIDGLNYYSPWGGDWAVWGGASFAFNEKATFNFQASYDDSETWGVVANVDYTLVDNFVITPEVTYSDDADDDDEWGGFLRLQYNWGS